MKTFNRQLLCTSLSLACFTGVSPAGTINWGGAFFTSNYQADGDALESGPTDALPSGQVMYEIGTFQNPDGSEFTPSFENIVLWESRWVEFDDLGGSSSSEYHEPSGYFGGITAFGTQPDQISTVESSETGGVLVHGFQAYIWGFDTKDLDGEANPEWFLATGKDGSVSGSTDENWVVPDSSASTNGTFGLVWDVCSASEAIVGRVGDSRGGGQMTDPLNPFGSCDHQFATVVPETGTTLGLAFLLSVGAFVRRRRAV